VIPLPDTIQAALSDTKRPVLRIGSGCSSGPTPRGIPRCVCFVRARRPAFAAAARSDHLRRTGARVPQSEAGCPPDRLTPCLDGCGGPQPPLPNTCRMEATAGHSLSNHCRRHAEGVRLRLGSAHPARHLDAPGDRALTRAMRSARQACHHRRFTPARSGQVLRWKGHPTRTRISAAC
jgi:hypothetical protein